MDRKSAQRVGNLPAKRLKHTAVGGGKVIEARSGDRL